MTHTIVFGTSEPQDFQLLDSQTVDGLLIGTGLTVGISFRTAGLTAAQITAVALVTVAWLTQATGKVRASAVQNLPIGTYHVRFTLTDGGGKVGFAPNLDAASDIWSVVRV